MEKPAAKSVRAQSLCWKNCV